MANVGKIVIRTCYKHKFRFVVLDQLSFDNYMLEFRKVFNIQAESKMLVEITDNLGTPIIPGTFDLMVDFYGRSGSFYLNVEFTGEKQDAALTTSKSLEAFLIRENATGILHENITTGELTQNTRRQLIKRLFDYLKEVYGDDPKPDDKIELAHATVALFPCMKTNESEHGIELIYNKSNGGYLGLKAKNNRRGKKNATETINTIDTDCIKEDLEFLESVVVEPQNIETITQKLKSTAKYRKEMMNDLNIDLQEKFPFFFSKPETVLMRPWISLYSYTNLHSSECNGTLLIDYNIRFNAETSNILIENWSMYSKILNNTLTATYGSHIYTQWPRDIQDILVLLKLLPATNKSKKVGEAEIEVFNKAIDKLFLFRKSGTSRKALVDNCNKSPYIIACGDTQEMIVHFFIDVDKHLIDVPPEYTAIQTFDLFFKAHKVFGLEYEPNIASLMKFCEHYLYKLALKNFKPSLRMIEVNTKLTTKRKL